MSRVPPDVARRLDALARAAHGFHRFAHHPLCARYAGEVVQLGRRRRVCRGCALAAAGLAAGLALGALAPCPAAGAVALLAALAAPALLLAFARSPRREAAAREVIRSASSAGGAAPPGRASKVWTRAAPATALATAASWGVRLGGATGTAAVAAAVAAGMAAVVAYRRRGPDRTACVACPERAGPVVCSGFRAIARREAAFRRIAGRMLSNASPDAAGRPA